MTELANPDPLAGGTTSRRGLLSRERILTTALALVDEHGLDALSMRRLAQELGAEPMSLYHHVPSKRALVDGLVGLVLAEVQPLDDLSGTWQDQIASACRRLRAVLLAHPRMAAAVATRPILAAASVALTESALTLLVAGGLSLREANEVLWLCNAFVMGTTATRAEWTADEPGATALMHMWADDPSIDMARYPLALATYGASPINSEEGRARFELGLEVLLAGIEAKYPHFS